MVSPAEISRRLFLQTCTALAAAQTIPLSWAAVSQRPATPPKRDEALRAMRNLAADQDYRRDGAEVYHYRLRSAMRQFRKGNYHGCIHAASCGF